MTRPTILIVEDDQDIRDSLRDAFEDEGYLVRCSVNGREGLEALDEFDLPAVIVLDLNMPVMSGNELYAVLQRDPRLSNIPVVISTSDPDRAPKGVIVMKKPTDLLAMLTTLEALCRPSSG